MFDDSSSTTASDPKYPRILRCSDFVLVSIFIGVGLLGILPLEYFEIKIIGYLLLLILGLPIWGVLFYIGKFRN